MAGYVPATLYRKCYYLGTFDTVEQAVDARRKAEIKYQPLPERIREDV